jgi:hypothetical protein
LHAQLLLFLLLLLLLPPLLLQMLQLGRSNGASPNCAMVAVPRCYSRRWAVTADVAQSKPCADRC